MSRWLGLWIVVLALPLAALGLLAVAPGLDLRWEHHPSHFWLVLTVAGVNVALGLVASEAAARRDDDRTFAQAHHTELAVSRQERPREVEGPVPG